MKKINAIESSKKIEADKARAGAILNQMLDAFWITDPPSGKIVEVNQAMCGLLGYSRQELLALNVEDVDTLESPEEIRRRIERVLHAGSAHFESRFRRKDGSQIDVEVSLTYLPLQNQIFGFHRDISARKRAEQEREALLGQVTQARDEIASARNLLNSILERVDDGFVAFDHDFNYTYVNPRGAELLGRRAEDLVGKNYWVEYPEARETPFTRAYLRAMETQQPQVFEDYYPYWKRWFANRVYPSPEGLTIFFTDTTERRQAEESLKRLNRELRAISQCSQVLVRAENEQSLLDDICRIICAEAGYILAWAGYAENDAEKTVRPVAWAGFEDGYVTTAHIVWADTEHGRGPTGTAIRTGQTIYTQDFETDPRLALWRDSALRRGYRSSIALPLKDDGGQVFGSLTIYSGERNAFTAGEIRLLEELAGDLAFGISVLRARAESRRMQRALEERARYIDTIMENAPIGFSVRGLQDGVARFTSSRFEEIYGLPHGAIHNLEDFYTHVFPDPVERQAMRQRIRADNESGDPARAVWPNIPIHLPSGELRYITATNLLLPEQGLAVATVQDVTARVRAEAALRESEVRFRAISEDSLIGVFIIQNSRLVYANAAMSQIVGYSRQELEDLDPLELACTEDRPLVKENLWRSLEGGSPTLHYEFRALCKDGSLKYVEALGALVDLNGQPTVIGNLLDLTERKQAEAQVARSLTEKETLLRELYHRTKNNMSVITALLGVQAGYFDDERLLRAFRDTQDRIRSMALVHQKLYESGDLSRINLGEYIRDLAGLMQQSYVVAPQRVAFDLALQDVYVLIDTAIPCGLLLNELISNALAHAFPAERSGEIRIRLQQSPEGEIRLEVADDGVGLPPGFDPRQDGSMGLRTLLTIAEYQLKASIRFLPGPGVTCQVVFKDNLYHARV